MIYFYRVIHLIYNILVEMWLINRSFGNIKNFWSKAARAREFNEGTSIKVSDYTHAPFKNNYEKLVAMFQLRLYHVNNTPYQFQSDIYTNDLANLHKELNFLQGRLFMKRLLLVFGILNVYIFFLME